MKKRASSLTRPEPTADTPAKRGPKKGQTINELKTPCKLFDARTRLNLSQSDLSRLSGVAQATISFIEDGTQKNPTRQIMVKLARGIAEHEYSKMPTIPDRKATIERRAQQLFAQIFWE